MNRINLNIKLIILPVVAIIAIVVLSILFSQKIDRLKKEVDFIYFGNFIPVHTLHNIKEKYIEIINTNKISKQNKEFIINNWLEYYKGFKTKDELETLKKINSQIIFAFKNPKKTNFQESLNHIKYLIRYETDSAYIKRKDFLQQYEEMQNYLFYSLVIISTFVLGITIFIIYEAITQTTKLKKLNEQYKIEANTDALTHLYNRKYFESIFTDILSISKQNSWTSVFIMIDIDYFKQFNDTYGHDAGDVALKKVAGVLDIILNKEYEYPFRLGGEEFGIIIFNTNEKYIQQILNTIQHHIAKLKIPHSASATGYLTLSMGVTVINEKNYNTSTKKIYKITDEKLYHSKENGRNQYTF